MVFEAAWPASHEPEKSQDTSLSELEPGKSGALEVAFSL